MRHPRVGDFSDIRGVLRRLANVLIAAFVLGLVGVGHLSLFYLSHRVFHGHNAALGLTRAAFSCAFMAILLLTFLQLGLAFLPGHTATSWKTWRREEGMLWRATGAVLRILVTALLLWSFPYVDAFVAFVLEGGPGILLTWCRYGELALYLGLEIILVVETVGCFAPAFSLARAVARKMRRVDSRLKRERQRRQLQPRPHA